VTEFEKDRNVGKKSSVGSGNTWYHSVQNVACVVVKVGVVHQEKNRD
jgi:hypothetical protein